MENLGEQFTEKQIDLFVDINPYKYRKCKKSSILLKKLDYSLSDIVQFKELAHYSTEMLYRAMKVCKNCFKIYQKLDSKRTDNILLPENRTFDVKKAKKEFSEFFGDKNAPIDSSI
jgi:hypothetical protein